MTNGQSVSWAAGRHPVGACYRLLLWVKGALNAESLAAWRQERTALLARMRDAGAKGSRGLLGRLEQELKALAAGYIEVPLAACGGAAFPLAHVSGLAERLRGEDAVLAFRLSGASVEALAELTGEEGLDELVARWKTATPGVYWCEEPLMEVLRPEVALAWQEARRSEACEALTSDEGESGSLPFRHVTVLAREAVEALQPAPGKVFIDATLGGGGHSERLLQAGAEVWGIDQDPAARSAAKRRLSAYGDRFHVLAGNFRHAARLLQRHGVGPADGLLADIGVSSPQVDCAQRGFSFLNDGPLDMRMDPSAGRSAADIVNAASEEELADILWQYGEERASRAIARRIVAERAKAPITRTLQLAGLIAGVLPRKGRQHPATRSFQALRIAVNDELGALEDLLRGSLPLLKSGGRVAVITFHSLEDRAVKRYFDHVTRPEIDRPEWPAPRPNPDYAARLVFRKPVVPSEEETATNPRARSAKLRVIEKV